MIWQVLWTDRGFNYLDAVKVVAGMFSRKPERRDQQHMQDW